jgi:hypothetical protein
MDGTCMDETLICMDDTYMYKTWMEMRLMCMDEIIDYDCCVWLYVCMIMCVCPIFKFKPDVKLKWGCVEPLVHSNFWRLEKPLKIGL